MGTAITVVPGNPPTEQVRPKTWLDMRHPEYTANLARWVFTWDVYTAGVLDNLETYLIKKMRGESPEAYQQRLKIADFTAHMATIVDSLCGSLASSDHETQRVFTGPDNQGGLGSITDPTTVIGKLWLRASADGASYPSVWKTLATYLVALHKAWIVADADKDGNPRICVLSPKAVVNWRSGPYGLEEVLVCDHVDTRKSIQDDPAKQEQYVLYTLAGWSRWTVSKDGLPMELDHGDYRFVDRDGNPTLPIFNVELPLKRPVGYMLARKNNAIFNLESSRDFLLWTANFPKLNIFAIDDDFDAIVAELDKGSNLLQNDPSAGGQGHNYIAPPTANAEITSKTIEEKRNELYAIGFRDYADATPQADRVTATQVTTDSQKGIHAFLLHLADAVDSAENETLLRIEQIVDKTVTKFVTSVKRSDKFTPLDPQLTIQNRVARYFGKDGVVPVGKTTLLAVAKQIADLDGVPVDDTELESAVEAKSLSLALAAANQLDVAPAELRVQLMLKIFVAAGLLDDKMQVTMADGSSRSLMDVITEQARALADAEDQATIRQAENPVPSFGGGNGGGGF